MRLYLAAIGLIATAAVIPAVTLSQTASTVGQPMTMAFACRAVPQTFPVQVSGYLTLVVAQASTKTRVVCRPVPPAMLARMGMTESIAQQHWVRDNILDRQWVSY